MNGMTVERQRPLAFVEEADAVISRQRDQDKGDRSRR
jgi:hypothetical protein